MNVEIINIGDVIETTMYAKKGQGGCLMRADSIQFGVEVDGGTVTAPRIKKDGCTGKQHLVVSADQIIDPQTQLGH